MLCGHRARGRRKKYMAIRESSFGYWSGRNGYVMVAAGAAIGIGNITRLPYLASQYGGSAFVICFMLAVLLMGWPLLVSEMLIGRWARQDVVGGFQRLALASGARPWWRYVGWLMLLSAALIASYLSVVAGWSLAYTLRAASGSLNGQSAEQLREAFLYLAQDPERSLAWHTLFMVMVCIVIGYGLRDGIERAVRLLIGAAVLGVVLLLWAAVERGAVMPALGMVFGFRPADLGWRGIMEALFQALFTVGVGIGAQFALASYLPAKLRVHQAASVVLCLILGYSLLGSIAVFALILGADLAPTPGLALIFQTLPQAMPPDWQGTWPVMVFYAVLVAVSLATALALTEAITLFLIQRLRATRVFAATGAAIAIWLLGLGTLLSFNLLAEGTILGRSFFEWAQWLTARVLTPVTALMICIFSARMMPPGLISDAWGDTPGWSYQFWRLLLLYPARIGLIMLLFYCLGVLDAAEQLWRG